ncbi:hypothetical protein [Bartonella doshiae]|nr:hypothetical protein [Bartonella doshiae]
MHVTNEADCEQKQHQKKNKDVSDAPYSLARAVATHWELEEEYDSTDL